jgi:hypothetical protein
MDWRHSNLGLKVQAFLSVHKSVIIGNSFTKTLVLFLHVTRVLIQFSVAHTMFLRGKERSAIQYLFRSSLCRVNDYASREAIIMPDNHLAQPLNFMQIRGFLHLISRPRVFNLCHNQVTCANLCQFVHGNRNILSQHHGLHGNPSVLLKRVDCRGASAWCDFARDIEL